MDRDTDESIIQKLTLLTVRDKLIWLERPGGGYVTAIDCTPVLIVLNVRFKDDTGAASQVERCLEAHVGTMRVFSLTARQYPGIGALFNKVEASVTSAEKFKELLNEELDDCIEL